MATRTVYYFCTRHFRETGMKYTNELVCQRIVAPDPRIDSLEKEYATKGPVYKIVYPTATSPMNRVWETEQIMSANRWDFNNRVDEVTLE